MGPLAASTSRVRFVAWAVLAAAVAPATVMPPAPVACSDPPLVWMPVWPVDELLPCSTMAGWLASPPPAVMAVLPLAAPSSSPWPWLALPVRLTVPLPATPVPVLFHRMPALPLPLALPRSTMSPPPEYRRVLPATPAVPSVMPLAVAEAA